MPAVQPRVGPYTPSDLTDGLVKTAAGVLAKATAGTDYVAPGGDGSALTGVLKTSSNLGDLGSASTARTNLGLGTAATLASDTDGTLAANSDTRVATQKAVKTYVDSAVTGLLDFKGSTNCSGNPNYPAASKGDSYVVSVAGKVGGASGTSVDVGDVYLATADNAGGTQAAVGSSWTVLEHNLTGALLAANNLNDVASVSTARTNLGLGGAAVLNVGTSAGTVAAGNDSRFTDSRAPNGSAGGDLSSTYPNPTVARINGIAYNADPLTQYVTLAGRTGGQTIIGGTASGNRLTLQSTSHATKGKVLFGGFGGFDEVNSRFGIGTTSPSNVLHTIATNATASSSFDVMASFAYTASLAATGQRAAALFGTAATHTTGTVGDIRGFQVSNTGLGNGGTTGASYGGVFGLDVSTGHTFTGAYGAYIQNPTGAGSIGTNHGLYIQSQTKGGANYAIYAAGGQSVHVGNLRVGGSSNPTYALDATGDVNASGVFRVGGTAGRTGSYSGIPYTGGTMTLGFTGGILTTSP